MVIGAIAVAAASCTKDALNKKPDATIAQPVTISDFQQLLDGLSGGALNNAPGLYSYLSLGSYLSDEQYVGDNAYNTYFSASSFITSLVKWDKGMFGSLTSLLEWNNQYKIILNANVALEGVNGITPAPGTQDAWNKVKGTALFIRGTMYYNLAQFWAKPYHAATAATDVGIVLRQSSDADVTSVRASVEASYSQMISDLKTAADLLPDNSAQNSQLSKVRPSKAAAYGMLARAYLAMGDSVNVFKYADMALKLYSTLLDYNTMAPAAAFNNFNAETIYTSMDQAGQPGTTYGSWFVTDEQVALYSADDRRKDLFVINNAYTAGNVFIGDYTGNYRFTGIAVDELYLMRAEASARMNNKDAAMADLNTLLVKRYQNYTPRTATNAGDALVQVITERRKELLCRGTRWTDLRRLNGDSRFTKTLSRTLKGITYTLPAGDSRYTLQIPDYIMAATKGSITQTP